MIKNFPKAELHCHLDGSIRPQTVKELCEKYDIETSAKTVEEYKALISVGENCDSLNTYLKCFDLPIKILQYEDTLERVTYELMEDASLENVKYIEIRFAPFQHNLLDLSITEVIEAVLRGMKRAEDDFEIKGNLILSFLRHHKPKQMFELIDAGLPFLGKGLVAVDLAGAEPGGFSERFTEPVAYAKEKGYHITIHAGETGYSRNIVESITELGAERIGHGVALTTNDEAYELVKEHNVAIECCPTSNLQTKAVRNIENHPINKFIKSGLIATINTDNRTVSNTTMDGELDLTSKVFSWDRDIWQLLYLNAVKASFADDATKEWLLTFI